MFFRNLTFFRFPNSAVPHGLAVSLLECLARPVGPIEIMTRGWVPPFGRGHEAMAHQVGDATWITLGGETRILPSSVINDALGKKIAEIEEAEGRRIGGRARKRIKEDIVAELLPRALVKPYRLNAFLHTGHGFIAVDTAGRKPAENLVSELRHTLGSFPALPLNAEVSVRAVLTGWLAGEPLPEGLALGEECVLQDPVDGGGIVRCSREELQTDEVRKHLEAGKLCTRLALVLDDHVSFVLGEDLVLRKVKFLDGAMEPLEQAERDGVAAELDARFALMAGEVARLFGVLERALKISAAGG